MSYCKELYSSRIRIMDREICGGGEYGETRCGEIDFKILAPLDRPRAKLHPQGSSPKVDSSIRDASKSRSVESRLEAKSRVQHIQRAVEQHDPQHGKHGVREITPKVQCHNFMTYWTKDIVHCTCGTCLRSSDKVRKLKSDRYDVLSIPNHVIKKGRIHIVGDSRKDPKRSGSSTHESRTICRKNFLHVDLQ